MAAFVDALPLNLRLRKGGIPYPRLKMNINSSDLCSRVTRYWALSNRISDMGWCTFNYQTRIWDSYPWGCYFSNIPTWQMSPSFRFEMVDLFYDGAAHSSSYPPTHWIMASFPFSGDYLIVIVGRNWQLLPTTLASRSPRFVGYEVSYFKNTKLTSLRLLQQIEISKNEHSNYTSFWRRCKVEISMLNWPCIQESNPASWQIQRPQLLCPILLDMPHIFTA